MRRLNRIVRAARKAKQLAETHDEKIGETIDKAARGADARTGGKHTERITKAREKAHVALHKVAGAPGEETTRSDGETPRPPDAPERAGEPPSATAPEDADAPEDAETSTSDEASETTETSEASGADSPADAASDDERG